MFKKKKQNRLPVSIVPRMALVQALARAEFDGNKTASAAAQRLIAAIDESPFDYLAI
jgi:hypothetical protein